MAKKRPDDYGTGVIREYDIGGRKYIVSSSPKAGAREDAAAIIRRLIRKEINEKIEK